jgi:hypothetical protein
VFRVVLSLVDVEGDDGFGIRVEADPDAEPSQAVGKARPRDRLAGLLVHDHDIHLRLIEGISRLRRSSIASFVDDMESEAHAKIFRFCGRRQPDGVFHAGVRRL